ncbi:MAG: helix-turn-helix transcriptional regulator [Roseovarius sp.]|nr:helix-turn-helix transcriptional regulator [Roseovarius sp.]MCY4208576.1 helix-turn-helix transcriptional regulator [Roseovarius sp.]
MMETAAKLHLSAEHEPPDDCEISVREFISLVGARVRNLRKSRNLSRRELSERSGVSLRYLAKLEGGDGNISIGLLKKVSIALNMPIAMLLSEDIGQAPETGRIAELYAKADSATRARVFHMLDPERTRAQKAERLCLVGLRGAGKSTLGAIAGREHGVPFMELNSEIEKSTGVPTSEVFALYGQEGYRQLEADALSSIVSSHSQAVVAVAGGIVSDEDTFHHLLSRFHTVWLQASAEEHMGRVRAQGDMRPMAGNPQAMVQLRQILKAREALYSLADHHLDTSGKTVEQSGLELSDLIRSNNIICDKAECGSFTR